MVVEIRGSVRAANCGVYFVSAYVIGGVESSLMETHLAVVAERDCLE